MLARRIPSLVPTSLTVNGNLSVTGTVTVGSAVLTWDAANSRLQLNQHLHMANGKYIYHTNVVNENLWVSGGASMISTDGGATLKLGGVNSDQATAIGVSTGRFGTTWSTGGARLHTFVNNATAMLGVHHDGVLIVEDWVDGSGTPGNATSNTGGGRHAIAAAAAACTITSNHVTANSMVFCSLEANDATATGIKSVVPAAGSFTVTANAAATANLPFSWYVVNR